MSAGDNNVGPAAGDQWTVWLVGEATDEQLLAEYQESVPGSVRRQRVVLASAMRNFARIAREQAAAARPPVRMEMTGPVLTSATGIVLAGGRN